MLKHGWLTILTLSLSFGVCLEGFAKDELCQWREHYTKAQKAYAAYNFFEARHEFTLAWQQAKKCQQHCALTNELEKLALSYKAQNNSFLAEPLFKLTHKLRKKFNLVETSKPNYSTPGVIAVFEQ